MTDTETIVCGNCQRPIAAANHPLHVSHCRRHLSVCTECGEAVPRDTLQEHRDTEHRPIECHLCGLHVPAGEMETHKEERCTGRAITCPYCELSMPYSSLEEHESYCGSRTELCPTCDVRVMYRHWPLHVESGHRLTKPETSPSQPPKDDCFEQAMLMAIELSKKTTTESPSKECEHCGLKFSTDQLQRHQGSCSWEQRRRQDSSSGRSAGSGGGADRDGPAPRWVARPVAADVAPEDAITLPCEFCEEAFLDADLLRHQLRCEKNPQRLDLPPRRTPVAERTGGLTKSRSASHADRQPEPEREPAREREPAGGSFRSSLRQPEVLHRSSSWREQEILSRSGYREQRQPDPIWSRRSCGDLDSMSSRYRTAGEAPATDRIRPGADLRSDLRADDALPRRWSLLDAAADAPPATPQRKSKHKKKVNFVGEEELIQPVPDQTSEVVDGEKKKKRSKEEKKQRKEEKKLKKRSSKSHRAPEPPGGPVITCDY